MQDVLDIIKNVESIYNSNTSFQVLKDFERVIDELDTYVYANWEDGELAYGPRITRHWVECAFMWDADKMPDPMGGMRLVDYDCKVHYKKDFIIVPRTIETPGDMRPGTKKGKLDKKAIWIVSIQMPKSLIADIYGGYQQQEMEKHEVTDINPVDKESQPADDVAGLDDPEAGQEEPLA
jgi:hypothetical protein